MALYSGYDTDDLTQRQYHYFCKLIGDAKGSKIDAICFLKYCVAKNFNYGQFSNYDGDCDWLLVHPEKAERAGINLEDVYR